MGQAEQLSGKCKSTPCMSCYWLQRRATMHCSALTDWQESHSRNWNVGVGKLLLAAKSRVTPHGSVSIWILDTKSINQLIWFSLQDEEEFARQLTLMRSEQLIPLSAASMEAGSYYRGYQYITRSAYFFNFLIFLWKASDWILSLQSAHVEWTSKRSWDSTAPEIPWRKSNKQCSPIQEQSLNFELHLGKPAANHSGMASSSCLMESSFRGQGSYVLLQASYRTQEPILNLRRVLLSLNNQRQEVHRLVGQCWLQSAKVARQYVFPFSAFIHRSVYLLLSLFPFKERPFADSPQLSLECRTLRSSWALHGEGQMVLGTGEWVFLCHCLEIISQSWE